MSSTTVSSYDVDITVEEFGSGEPLVLLHSEEGPASAYKLAEELSRSHTVLLPHHPGFGRTPRLNWEATVQDLAYIYSELLLDRGLERVPVVGSSFGAWVALELAAMAPNTVSSLGLVGPIGIKMGGRDVRDFVDIYAISQMDLLELAYYSPPDVGTDFDSLSIDELEIIVSNRESFMLFGWEPYLHSTSLSHHSGRIKAPTLVVSGTADRFVRDGYYDELTKVLPNATHVALDDCGHFPDIECPQDVARLALQHTQP